MLNRPLFISLKIMLLLVLLLVEILFDFFTACLISSHGQHNCYQLSFKLLSAFIPSEHHLSVGTKRRYTYILVIACKQTHQYML